MQFGVFYQAPEHPPQTHAERFADMLEMIRLSETLGFDAAWLAEIHFGGAFSLLSAPLMVISVIAQHTQRIRLGTAVTLLPLHHPLACAEQAATADVLAGGRLEFGVGRGSIPSQFHGFGVPVSENRARFDEALDIIRLAWTQERFSYRGQFHTVENVSVVPKPLQQPHPPIRVAVHTTESFDHIGRRGWPMYSGTTTTPLPELRAGMALYREQLQAYGHTWQAHQAALMMPVHVGTTSSAARQAMRAGVEKYYRNILALFSHIPDTYKEHLPRLQKLQETIAHLPFDNFCQHQAVFGDAQECIDRLQAVRDEFGLSQLICWFDQGNMLPGDEAKHTMRRFVEQVMPKL